MEKRFLSSLSRLVKGERTPDKEKGSRLREEAGAVQRGRASEKIAYLSAMTIFRDLSPEQIKMIEGATVMTTAPKGRIIYMPGETGEALFLLKRGSVHLYRLSSEGRKLIVQTVGPMTFFGQMASFGQSMQDVFAEAAEESLLCVMGRADLERLILSKPQVALRMLEEVGQRMHDAQERLGESAFKGIPARAASLLLRLSDGGAREISGMSHQDLADWLGVYRETITNTLDKLRNEGLIEISRKKIEILDVERLRAAAEEEVLRKR